MADLSDVTSTLASLAAAAIYPNGSANPSVAGVGVTIAPGWPNPAQLDDILSVGNVMVTVFPMPGMDANTTRFLMEEPTALISPVSSLTMTVSGNTVTVGGGINPGEAAYIGVNRTPYTHLVVVGDTTATIASSLAALILGATVSGSVVTIGLSMLYDLTAGVSAIASLQEEIARQKRVFMITAWCPNPSLRDTVVKAIDVYLKSVIGRRILLPDNTYGVMIYRGTLETDELSTRNLFRRDLRYEVEYATTVDSISNTITNVQTGISINGAASIEFNVPRGVMP